MIFNDRKNEGMIYDEKYQHVKKCWKEYLDELVSISC